jgi:hypothetical protein
MKTANEKTIARSLYFVARAAFETVDAELTARIAKIEAESKPAQEAADGEELDRLIAEEDARITEEIKKSHFHLYRKNLKSAEDYMISASFKELAEERPDAAPVIADILKGDPIWSITGRRREGLIELCARWS